MSIIKKCRNVAGKGKALDMRSASWPARGAPIFLEEIVLLTEIRGALGKRGQPIPGRAGGFKG